MKKEAFWGWIMASERERKGDFKLNRGMRREI